MIYYIGMVSIHPQLTSSPAKKKREIRIETLFYVNNSAVGVDYNIVRPAGFKFIPHAYST